MVPPMTSSPLKRLEVIDMKTMATHVSDRLGNNKTRERIIVENISEKCFGTVA